MCRWTRIWQRGFGWPRARNGAVFRISRCGRRCPRSLRRRRGLRMGAGEIMNFRFSIFVPPYFRFWAAGFAAILLIGVGIALAQHVHPDPALTKNSEQLREVFDDVTAGANAATVSVRWQNDKGVWMQAALGTVVSKDGFVLTKAS